MMSLPRIVLKKGREKPLLRGHPWVFSGAVERMDRDVSPGETGEVYSREGHFLGVGHFNPHSQIILRFLSRKKEEIGAQFYKDRILEAARWRRGWITEGTNAFRVANGEGDYLPGLIIDRYGDTWVLQCLTAGMERSKALLVDCVAALFHPKSIYERSDAAARREEGLPEMTSLLYGEEVPDEIEIVEDGCRFKVNVKAGHKTGFYLDQRENRRNVGLFAEKRRILDCFCYTGGFSVHAGLNGAGEITLIDSSETVLHLAEEQFHLNGLETISRRLIKGDAFQVLRSLTGPYDLIVVDPPPFARRKGHIQKASKGYKDLNLQAFRLLGREGLLFTFSCSHHISPDLFQKIVFSAAADAEKKVQLLGRRGHPMDHPIDLSHPEGEYLKGLICKVL